MNKEIRLTHQFNIECPNKRLKSDRAKPMNHKFLENYMGTKIKNRNLQINSIQNKLTSLWFLLRNVCNR